MSELNFLDTGGNKQKITTPVVNSLAFNTANTERVRIDSSGRVLWVLLMVLLIAILQWMI